MSYTLRHLQVTSHAIAESCSHDDGSKLSKSRKRILSEELIAELHRLGQKNPKVIVVSPSNRGLEALFNRMAEDKIQFPEHTTFILKLCGSTFKKVDHLRLDVNERLDKMLVQIQSDLIKFDGSALSLDEQASVEAQFKEHVLEALKLKPQILRIQTKNKDLAVFFRALVDLKVLFPPHTEYTLHRNGDCHKRTPTATTCIYQHQISREEICSNQNHSHKSQLEKLSKQFKSLELSNSSSDEEQRAPMIGWSYKPKEQKVSPISNHKHLRPTF